MYNNWCVDCHQAPSRFFVLNLGVFVCAECAGEHARLFPYQKHYLKALEAEHYDPNQLKFLQAASNQEFYELMKDYQLDGRPISQKYTSTVAQWHQRKLEAAVHGYQFFERKPTRLAPWQMQGIQTVGQQMASLGNGIFREFNQFHW